MGLLSEMNMKQQSQQSRAMEVIEERPSRKQLPQSPPLKYYERPPSQQALLPASLLRDISSPLNFKTPTHQ
jgi:hypothetical protein